jgi:hypothetical protein
LPLRATPASHHGLRLYIILSTASLQAQLKPSYSLGGHCIHGHCSYYNETTSACAVTADTLSRCTKSRTPALVGLQCRTLVAVAAMLVVRRTRAPLLLQVKHCASNVRRQYTAELNGVQLQCTLFGYLAPQPSLYSRTFKTKAS